MSAGTTFPGHMGANSNPFGASSMSSGRIHQVAEEDETTAAASSLFGVDGSFGSGPSSFKPVAPEGFPNSYGMGRRTSVSAESLKPTATSGDSWKAPIHQKSSEQTALIKKALSGDPLLGHLDEEQNNMLANAMVVMDIPAKDIKVITQGDDGDYFYIVESGSFDVYVHESGKLQSGPDGLGKKVANIKSGGHFGELALLHGAPRNATVMSAEANGRLLALDRITFRRILMDNTFARRRMYEKFLAEVAILSSLEDAERAKIADALDTQKFAAGETVIREGDKGEAFYLLESGEAEAFKSGINEPVKRYSKGDYFGELALLNDAPRAASVVAKTEVKVACLGKDGFQRLLGPVEGILRRTKYDDENVDPLSQK